MEKRKAKPADWSFASSAPERTEALARSIAERMRGGEILLLRGPLGAGKTFFTSALAAALGVEDDIVSPTFVLLRSYETERGLTLHHLDFYRFESEADLETIGVEELVTPESVTVVEWPERCPNAFDSMTLELTFKVTGDESREVEGRWGELPFDRSDLPNDD